MENFDIERLHADCLKWCENPVWKPWQQEYRLEKMTGNYRRILDKHRSLIASLYDDSDLYDGLPTMQFAHLIGLNVESYRKEAAPEPTHSRLSAFLILQNEFGWERDKKDSWRWYKDAYTIRVLDSCNGKTSCFLVCKKVGSDTPIDFLFDYGKEDGLRKWLGRFDEAPTPEKEIEAIEQEAHEILIGKGFEWNEVHKEWRKKELQIWHGDDGYYFARFHNHNIPARLPSMPFASWVESVEKMTAEPEKEIEAAPLSGLLKGEGNLLSAHSAFRKALEDRFQPTLECLTNDRQDRIEILKLAVKATKGQDKDLRVVKAMIAYKRFAKLVGLDEPQPQIVEPEAPDSPKVPQANAQDPRKVLAENGWMQKNHPYVDLYEKDGIELWWSGDIWIIKLDDKKARWDGTAANLAELTAKPAANALAPEEVLRTNGWTPDGTRNYYTYWTKDGICVFWNGDNWGIRQDIERVTQSHFWNPDKCSFSEWLATETANLQAPNPEQPAAEQEKVECTITRMELVPCKFGRVEFGYAAIDAKGKKYLLSHYGIDEVATAEVLRLAYSTMASAGAVRLEDLIGRKILVMPSESNALLLPLEFV